MERSSANQIRKQSPFNSSNTFGVQRPHHGHAFGLSLPSPDAPYLLPRRSSLILQQVFAMSLWANSAPESHHLPFKSLWRDDILKKITLISGGIAVTCKEMSHQTLGPGQPGQVPASGDGMCPGNIPPLSESCRRRLAEAAVTNTA